MWLLRPGQAQIALHWFGDSSHWMELKRELAFSQSWPTDQVNRKKSANWPYLLSHDDFLLSIWCFGIIKCFCGLWPASFFDWNAESIGSLFLSVISLYPFFSSRIHGLHISQCSRLMSTEQLISLLCETIPFQSTQIRQIIQYVGSFNA